MTLTTCDLPPPHPWPGANRRLLLGGGAPIQPLVRLSTFSPDEFEIFVLEWVHGYLSKNYNTVKRCGGAGDMGRDIIAWVDPEDAENRQWDNYQCKHYDASLTPSEFWVELGKLCYYTFKRFYTVPRKYCVVTHRGIGTKLKDLFDNPSKLRQGLIENWDAYCSEKITKRARVELTGSFRSYVADFDFSILREIDPVDLIEQHSHTRYHALIFGTRLQPRPMPPRPPEAIHPQETRYVQQIYEAFADHLHSRVTGAQDFAHRLDLIKQFGHARVCFYSAESLKEFARDNLPDDSYFRDLLDQFLEGLSVTLYRQHPDGYHRLIEASEKAITLQIDSNSLQGEMRPNDRVGICHHLANEDLIRWVQ